MPKLACDVPPRQFFLTGARIGFGIWLFYAGLMKWLGGPENFIGFITTEFGKTWSPSGLNLALAWLIIIAEPVLALWLISGIRQRCAWTATTLLMFLLMMGMSILQKPETAYNFHYTVFCLLCAAWSGPSCQEAER